MCQFSPCGKPWLDVEQGEGFMLLHRRRLGVLQGINWLVGKPSIHHHFHWRLQHSRRVCKSIKVWLIGCTWLLHIQFLSLKFITSFFIYRNYSQRKGSFCGHKETSVSSNLRGKEPVRTFGIWSLDYRRRKLIKETLKTMKKASQKRLLSLASRSPRVHIN